MTKELIESAQHDVQKFKVDEFLNWAVNADGEVDILVKWRGHDDTNNTWEPLPQLVSDVPALVTKYVKDNAGWPDLDREYKKAVRMMKKKKKRPKTTPARWPAGCRRLLRRAGTTATTIRSWGGVLISWG